MELEIFLTPDQIKAIRAGDNRILIDEDQSEGLIESYFERKEAECSASFPFEMFDADAIAEHCVGKPIEILRHTLKSTCVLIQDYFRAKHLACIFADMIMFDDLDVIYDLSEKDVENIIEQVVMYTMYDPEGKETPLVEALNKTIAAYCEAPL